MKKAKYFTLKEINFLLKKWHNNRFNLANPLAWFLREDGARTTPSPAGADLKVKRMLAGLASLAIKKNDL